MEFPRSRVHPYKSLWLSINCHRDLSFTGGLASHDVLAAAAAAAAALYPSISAPPPLGLDRPSWCVLMVAYYFITLALWLMPCPFAFHAEQDEDYIASPTRYDRQSLTSLGLSLLTGDWPVCYLVRQLRILTPIGHPTDRLKSRQMFSSGLPMYERRCTWSHT